ncbi:MAG TPA: cytochrome b/b6 domain-containing protein [Negativicutes bacterium]
MSHHDENGPRVLKHGLSSRMFHWGLILGFIPAALTGFVIWLKPGSEDFVNLAMRIHIIGAVILSLSAILYVLTSLDRVIAFIRLIFTWDSGDIKWMKIGGGYMEKIFLGKEIPVPPMDKVNSGQKMMGLMMLFGGIFLIITGWILYAFIPVAPKSFIYWADLGHLWIGVILGLSMFAHIGLGIYNWGEFKAMFGDGTQPLSEAEHHNPLWVANKIEPVKDLSDKQSSTVGG